MFCFSIKFFKDNMFRSKEIHIFLIIVPRNRRDLVLRIEMDRYFDSRRDVTVLCSPLVDCLYTSV